MNVAVQDSSGFAHDGVSDRQVGDPVSVRVAVPASRAVTVHERLELPSSETSALIVTASPSITGSSQT